MHESWTQVKSRVSGESDAKDGVRPRRRSPPPVKHRSHDAERTDGLRRRCAQPRACRTSSQPHFISLLVLTPSCRMASVLGFDCVLVAEAKRVRNRQPRLATGERIIASAICRRTLSIFVTSSLSHSTTKQMNRSKLCLQTKLQCAQQPKQSRIPVKTCPTHMQLKCIDALAMLCINAMFFARPLLFCCTAE